VGETLRWWQVGLHEVNEFWGRGRRKLKKNGWEILFFGDSTDWLEK